MKVGIKGYFQKTLRGKYIPLKVGEKKSKVTKEKGKIFTHEIIDQSMMENAWVPPSPLICTGCPPSYVQAYVQGYVTLCFSGHFWPPPPRPIHATSFHILLIFFCRSKAPFHKRKNSIIYWYFCHFPPSPLICTGCLPSVFIDFFYWFFSKVSLLNPLGFSGHFWPPSQPYVKSHVFFTCV